MVMAISMGTATRWEWEWCSNRHCRQIVVMDTVIGVSRAEVLALAERC